MKKLFIIIFIFTIFSGWQKSLSADQEIISKKVKNAPLIDGKTEDPSWAEAKAVITHDVVADLDIEIKTVYAGKKIFFLVAFDDPDESRLHKSWVWNKNANMYDIGSTIEDCFIFKWNMETEQVDLSVRSNDYYQADLWFWKANRTDPAGYADDKMHILSSIEIKNSLEVISEKGKKSYFTRKGDNGKTAYKTVMKLEYEGDKISRFVNTMPAGSRADVKAKGVWENGKWTIEFERLLNTGNEDDIGFDIKKKYQFGVSRYEIAGRPPNPKIDQPLYGAGEVSENIFLVFEK